MNESTSDRVEVSGEQWFIQSQSKPRTMKISEGGGSARGGGEEVERGGRRGKGAMMERQNKNKKSDQTFQEVTPTKTGFDQGINDLSAAATDAAVSSYMLW